MQIDDKDILRYQELSIEQVMDSIDSIDYNTIVAYALDENGLPLDSVLLVEVDKFTENDDEFLIYNNNSYNWEIIAQAIKGVKKNYIQTFSDCSKEGLVGAFRYFVVNRAYLPPNPQ